jgi:hypothetical protein
MPIRFACPACNAVMNAPDGKAGRKVSCPKCGQRLQIPAPPKGTILAKPLPPKRESLADQTAPAAKTPDWLADVKRVGKSPPAPSDPTVAEVYNANGVWRSVPPVRRPAVPPSSVPSPVDPPHIPSFDGSTNVEHDNEPAVSNSEPQQSGPPSGMEQYPQSGRKRRLSLRTALVVVVLLVVGAGIFSCFGLPSLIPTSVVAFIPSPMRPTAATCKDVAERLKAQGVIVAWGRNRDKGVWLSSKSNGDQTPFLEEGYILDGVALLEQCSTEQEATERAGIDPDAFARGRFKVHCADPDLRERIRRGM